ncbi:hypothetical protein ACFQ5N_04215 [Lutibacter holmesii]|uniref:Outer membrane protein beta-barrel domain-containing protein n=1 Tax=Lutibacter holmesii TaxID=1137985 RepID=A0ABW3WP16_9FLAO
MKKLAFTLFLCGITLIAKAQDASVEKSVFGIQTGLLGIWAHHEARLSNKFALRSEIGLDSGIHNDDFFMVPGVSLEPKFYYNLNKRVTKSKDITGNSGSFLSLKTSYHPDWFIISKSDNYNVSNQISIVPTWGMRRNIGKHFNYELGIGIGWLHEFADTVNNYKYEASNETAINLHTRIGYRF